MILTRRAALAQGGAVLALGGGTLSLPRWAFGATDPLGLVGRQVQGGWLRGKAPRGIERIDLVAAPDPAKGAAQQAVRVPLQIASDRGLFIGFDRDAGQSATLILHGPAAGGFADVLDAYPLTIAPGAWEIEQVDAPFHPPAMPDETFAHVRKAELAQIDAARTRDTGAQGWRQRFAWPVRGRISGKFGAQRVYRGPSGQPQPGSYHSGVDIATGESGTPYAAPADGVVVLAASAPFTLEGNLLIIDHGMGLSSAFLHSSALHVAEGDKVVQGQPLGQIGMTGRATGPHLHWGLRWREARLDPALMAGPMGN